MTISIRILLAVLLLVVAIAAAVTAFLPVYLTSVESLRTLGFELRDQISQRLTLQVQVFFDAPMSFVSTVAAASRMGIVDAFNPPTILQQICNIGASTDFFAYTGTQNGEMITCSTGSAVGTVSVPGSPGWRAYYDVDNATRSWQPTFDRNVSRNSGYDPRQRPWYPPLISAQLWSEVYVNSGGGSSVITAGSPLKGVGQVQPAAAFAMDISTFTILDFLRDVKIMKTGRALLAETKTTHILGGNWNESAIITINATRQQFRLAKLADYKDELLGRTVAALGEDFLFNGTLPASGEFDKGLDAVLWSITNVTDEFGLDMRVVTMIPARDFLEDVQRNVNVGIGAAAAAVIVLIVLSFLLVMFLLAPLKRVENQIECAANFQTPDDGADDSPSVISEVANIQAAYKKLQSELEMIKSYLPQSLLANLYDDEALDLYAEEAAATGPGSKQPTQRDSASGVGTSHHGMSHPQNSRSGAGTNDDTHSHQSYTNGHDSSSAWSQMSAGTRQKALGAKYRDGGNRDRGLNTQGGIALRMATVMVVNLRRFHAIALHHGIDRATAVQVALLDIVKQVADKHSGVIDTFNGDHVVVTFGAVAQQSAAAPKACLAGREIIGRLANSETVRPYYGCSIGIATGEAHVGNMGSTALRKFNVLSPIVSQAFHLERLCKLQKVDLLVSNMTARFANYELHLEPLDAIRLPREVQPAIVYTVFGPKLSQATDGRQIEEWMYEVQRQNEAKEQDEVIAARFRRATSALLLFIRGDSNSLATLLNIHKRAPSSSSEPGVEEPATNAPLGSDTGAKESHASISGGGGAEEEEEDSDEHDGAGDSRAPRGMQVVMKQFASGGTIKTYLQARELEFFEKCIAWDE